MPAAVVKDGTVTPKFRQGKISPPFLTAKFSPQNSPLAKFPPPPPVLLIFFFPQTHKFIVSARPDGPDQ